MSRGVAPLPPLPWRGRLYNLLGAASARVRGDVFLDRGRLLDFARTDTGLEDFGRAFDPALLDLLISSAEQADLTYLGRRSVNGVLSMALSVRLMFVEARKRHPAIFAGPVAPPLIVAGPPRSGTTLLQNLLALHPDFDALQNWELQRPVPPSLIGKEGPDNRLELALASDRAALRLTSKGDHIHFHRATTPGECIVLMLSTLRSWGFLGLAPLYPFLDALMQSDHRTLYAEYADLLKLVQHAHPGRRLLLKAPAHTPYVDCLLEVVPNASVVVMNRNLVETTTSLLSLHRHGFSRTVRAYDVRAHSLKILDAVAFGMGRFWDVRGAHEESIHDVFYPQLVSDPAGSVRGIYQRFGIRWPEGHEERIRAYLKANPKGKHGKHRYGPVDFGLREEEIRARVAPWNEHFSRSSPP